MISVEKNLPMIASYNVAASPMAAANNCSAKDVDIQALREKLRQ